jgi:hypothetical protein
LEEKQVNISTVFQRAILLLSTLLLVSNAFAQGDDKNKPEFLEIAPRQMEQIGLPEMAPGPYGTVESACDKYASGSVKQNNWQLKQTCGYKSAAWSSDYQYHYNWCVQGDNLKYTSSEFRKRQEAIAECICNPYAKNAVAQNNDNIALGCGYTGPRWSSDHAHHYNWCARGGGNIIESGSWDIFRSDKANDLEKCKKNFCDNYAKVSIAQNKDNESKKCGFSGPKWSSDYNHHFNWCLKNWKITKTEMESRKTALSQNCKPAPPPPPPPPSPKEETTTVYGYMQTPYTGNIYYIAKLNIPKATALSISNPNLGLGKQWIVQIIPGGASSQDCGKPGKTIDIPPGSSSTKIKGTSLYNFVLGFCLTTKDSFTWNQGLPKMWGVKIKYQKK